MSEYKNVIEFWFNFHVNGIAQFACQGVSFLKSMLRSRRVTLHLKQLKCLSFFYLYCMELFAPQQHFWHLIPLWPQKKMQVYRSSKEISLRDFYVHSEVEVKADLGRESQKVEKAAEFQGIALSPYWHTAEYVMAASQQRIKRLSKES